MIEQSGDVPGGIAPAAALPEPLNTHRRRGQFCYCGECGSWDAHGIECLCCGYDFRAQPPAPIQPIG